MFKWLFTKEEINETCWYVQDVIDWWEKMYRDIRNDKSIKSLLYKFHCMPRMEIHNKWDKFVKPIVKEIIEKRQKNEDYNLFAYMDKYKEYWEYEILRTDIIKKDKWEEKCVVVWIPFYDQKVKETKFKWTVCIFKSKAPKTFYRCYDNLQKYMK